MNNERFYVVVGLIVFMVFMVPHLGGQTLGHMIEYKENCDELYYVPAFWLIKPTDQSYYFKNPEASCEKLILANHLQVGILFFSIGLTLWITVTFFTRNEIRIQVRSKY